MTLSLATKPRILLVESKPENNVIIEKALLPLDVQLIKVSTGNEALAYALEQAFMLMFVDAQIPGMNGYELFDVLSWDDRTRHIPVIFITANYANEIHRLKGYSAGSVDYLSKPIHEQVLLSKVKLHLQHYQQQQQLTQVQADYQAILESTSEGILGIDEQGQIRFANPAVSQLLGWELSELTGKKMQTLLAKSTQQTQPVRWQETPLYQQCLQGNIYKESNAELIKRNGDTLPVQYSATPRHDQQQSLQSILLVFSDRTLQQNLERQIREHAHYDFLTHLPNRLLFEKSLTQEVARCRRHHHSMSLLVIDIDHFKLVNERLGHDVGNLLLQSFAKRLQGCIRINDTVARLEGDQFAIILDHVKNENDTQIVADKVLANLQKPYQIQQHVIHTKVSIGMAVTPEGGQDATALLQQALRALNQAKNKGGNQTCLYVSPIPHSQLMADPNPMTTDPV